MSTERFDAYVLEEIEETAALAKASRSLQPI